MTTEDFQTCRQKCTQGIPTLLVAGSTSSGKTSLINALLGEEILPVSYSCSTTVLCEVKYSKSGKRYAVAFIEKDDGEMEEEELDLSLEADRIKFARYVSCLEDDSEESEDSLSVCRKVDLYWPSHFLESVTIVDSPGVTTKTGYSEVRRITEHFQSKLACAILYVLDTTRSGDEAGEAGGLLASLGAFFPCRSAGLFILGKWDLSEIPPKSDEEQEFMARVKRKLVRHWPGFSRRQLLCLDAKSA
eukprot:m.218389 g.218389  ORF g.218389 m.218389 type:complete len:246 (+) comp39895_c2_seq15:1121-1858(+)